MSESEKEAAKRYTRRDALRLSTLALGGLAVGGAAVGPGPDARAAEACVDPGPCYPDYVDETQTYSYFFKNLPTINPINPSTRMYDPPASNELRIVFLGSMIPPTRRAQQMMSVYVEVGNALGEGDSFVFDCGSGVCANYAAMGIPFGKMNKVFISHLHGDHMSDLTHIYCFGPSGDRKTPLYVWGPSRSGQKNPKAPPDYYEDGVTDMCKAYRKAWRWHSESFSFLATDIDDPNYTPPTKKDWGLPHDPVPVDNDSARSGFGLIPIELNWKKYGKKEGDNVAYYNEKSGVKITHFPVIHCRKGSIGYKLEWNGLTIMYTSDTRPEFHSVGQASNNGRGVDVFIHEMVVPPDVWAFKQMNLTAPPPNDGGQTWQEYQAGVQSAKTVQESSHSPQGAFGFLLSKIQPPPRLTVATHFPVADDTVACAFNSVKQHCPWVVRDPAQGQVNLTWSFDLMVLKVLAGVAGSPQIYRAEVSDYTFGSFAIPPSPLKTPKYHDKDGNPDPTKQLDLETLIYPTDRITGDCNYLDSGY